MQPGVIDVGTVQCTAGRLTINSFLLAKPWVLCPDLSELWVPTKASYRGQNVLIPGAIGRLATPRRLDEANVDVPLLISGFVDDLGAFYSDPWVGLETNIAALHTAIDQPVPPSTTVAAVLTMPSGATRNANVQVDGIKVGAHASAVFRCALELTIPSGGFA